MSELGKLQMKLSLMVAKIIIYAYELGYTITLGEAYNAAGIGHKPNSNHYIKLAIDLNLFIDGEYIQDGRGHDKLHDEWDKMGGAPRIAKDLNHYSVVYNGKW